MSRQATGSRGGGRTGRLASAVAGHAVAITISAVCALPVLLVLMASLRPLESSAGFAPSLTGWTLENYVNLLSNDLMARWIFNSVLVAIMVTALTVAIDLMAGFAFAKLRFPGRGGLFLLLISTMMLPFSITLVPTFLLVSRYDLLDSYAGLVLPVLSGPLGVYLMRQFIANIPDALLEAARIDGASSLRIFVSIVVPLARQPMVVLAVFTFAANWNSFIWPLLITQSDEMKTLPVGMATTDLEHVQNLGGITAQAIISLLPTAMLFFVFQRHFLQGITAGALKG